LLSPKGGSANTAKAGWRKAMLSPKGGKQKERV